MLQFLGHQGCPWGQNTPVAIRPAPASSRSPFGLREHPFPCSGSSRAGLASEKNPTFPEAL